MATKIEGWEYQNGEWSMYDEISFYRHFVGKEEEPSERPATLVLHDGKHEPVFTASEVRAMLDEALGRMAIYRASGSVILVEVAKSRLGITLEHP